MARNIFDYFARRADEEAERAELSTHPVVKATHERFAAFYRERVESGSAPLDAPPGTRA